MVQDIVMSFRFDKSEVHLTESLIQATCRALPWSLFISNIGRDVAIDWGHT